MPLYEYRCQDCRRRSTLLVRTLSGSHEPICQHCGSKSVLRLISRFSFRRSWGDSLESGPESGFPDEADMQDPRKMAQWMRHLQSETGEESTPEFEEMLEEVESGRLGDEDDDAGDMDDE